jgi:nuclease S1
MPEKLIGGYALTDAQTWAASLTSAIDSGKYASEKSSWLSGTSISDPITTAMGWSGDANAYVCTNVLPKGVSAVETGDLSGAYYQGNTDVIQLLVAKGMSFSGS